MFGYISEYDDYESAIEFLELMYEMFARTFVSNQMLDSRCFLKHFETIGCHDDAC